MKDKILEQLEVELDAADEAVYDSDSATYTTARAAYVAAWDAYVAHHKKLKDQS